MVLPQPAADAGRARAWAFTSGPLASLKRRFERHEPGTLVLLHGAVPTRLAEVVQFFSQAPPWHGEEHVMRVCMGAGDLASVPEGSRMLLRVREEEVAYLNVIRPFFAERRLRTLLWVETDVVDSLLRRAPDLVDWVFRTVEVPPRRWPAFAEEGVRAALEAGVPFAWDGERAELEALLGDVGWTDGIVVLRASMSVREMLRALDGAPGLVVVEGIGREADAWRVRMALARSGRSGSWVAVQPVEVPVGSWRLHARQADWDEATQRLAEAGWEHPGLMAAWVDLEPERIDEAVTRAGVAPVDASEWEATRIAAGDGPVHVLRARIGDDDVREARARLREGEVPEGEAARVVWAEGAEAWRDDAAAGTVDARLVRYLRCLGDGTPAERSVEAAAESGLGDVAAELGRIRFERGADDRADDVVERLTQYGEIEEAFRVAEEWAKRARLADDQQSLGAAWTWLGDLQRALGKGEQARRHYEDGLAIAKVLAEREPGRSDLQRDLSISYERLGDLQRALGNAEQARRYYEDSLAIAKVLAEREPGRSDLQRDLSISYERLGDLQRALGNAEQARGYYEDGLAIHKMLAERELGRSDLQRDLSISFIKLGDVQRVLGNAEQARRYYEDGLAIAKVLAEREPGRSDLQRDLSISLTKLGELHEALGNAEQVWGYYEDGLAIIRMLVEREPGRLDLQRDLSVSFIKLGELHEALGNAEQARRYYEDGLAITKMLVEREPGRSDLQRDLSIFFIKLGDLHEALGNAEQARRYYEDDLAIAKRLAEREPGRSDLQRDLSISYDRMASVDPGDAVSWLTKAVDLVRVLLERDPTNAIIRCDLAVALAELGHTLEEQGKSEEASAPLEEARSILQDLRDRGALEASFYPLFERLTRA